MSRRSRTSINPRKSFALPRNSDFGVNETVDPEQLKILNDLSIAARPSRSSFRNGGPLLSENSNISTSTLQEMVREDPEWFKRLDRTLRPSSSSRIPKSNLQSKGDLRLEQPEEPSSVDDSSVSNSSSRRQLFQKKKLYSHSNEFKDALVGDFSETDLFMEAVKDAPHPGKPAPPLRRSTRKSTRFQLHTESVSSSEVGESPREMFNRWKGKLKHKYSGKFSHVFDELRASCGSTNIEEDDENAVAGPQTADTMPEQNSPEVSPSPKSKQSKSWRKTRSARAVEVEDFEMPLGNSPVPDIGKSPPKAPEASEGTSPVVSFTGKQKQLKSWKNNRSIHRFEFEDAESPSQDAAKGAAEQSPPQADEPAEAVSSLLSPSPKRKNAMSWRRTRSTQRIEIEEAESPSQESAMGAAGQSSQAHEPAEEVSPPLSPSPKQKDAMSWRRTRSIRRFEFEEAESPSQESAKGAAEQSPSQADEPAEAASSLLSPSPKRKNAMSWRRTRSTQRIEIEEAESPSQESAMGAAEQSPPQTHEPADEVSPLADTAMLSVQGEKSAVELSGGSLGVSTHSKRSKAFAKPRHKIRASSAFAHALLTEDSETGYSDSVVEQNKSTLSNLTSRRRSKQLSGTAAPEETSSKRPLDAGSPSRRSPKNMSAVRTKSRSTPLKSVDRMRAIGDDDSLLRLSHAERQKRRWALKNTEATALFDDALASDDSSSGSKSVGVSDDSGSLHQNTPSPKTVSRPSTPLERVLLNKSSVLKTPVHSPSTRSEVFLSPAPVAMKSRKLSSPTRIITSTPTPARTELNVSSDITSIRKQSDASQRSTATKPSPPFFRNLSIPSIGSSSQEIVRFQSPSSSSKQAARAKTASMSSAAGDQFSLEKGLSTRSKRQSVLPATTSPKKRQSIGFESASNETESLLDEEISAKTTSERKSSSPDQTRPMRTRISAERSLLLNSSSEPISNLTSTLSSVQRKAVSRSDDGGANDSGPLPFPRKQSKTRFFMELGFSPITSGALDRHLTRTDRSRSVTEAQSLTSSSPAITSRQAASESKQDSKYERRPSHMFQEALDVSNTSSGEEDSRPPSSQRSKTSKQSSSVEIRKLESRADSHRSGSSGIEKSKESDLSSAEEKDSSSVTLSMDISMDLLGVSSEIQSPSISNVSAAKGGSSSAATSKSPLPVKSNVSLRRSTLLKALSISRTASPRQGLEDAPENVHTRSRSSGKKTPDGQLSENLSFSQFRRIGSATLSDEESSFKENYSVAADERPNSPTASSEDQVGNKSKDARFSEVLNSQMRKSDLALLPKLGNAPTPSLKTNQSRISESVLRKIQKTSNADIRRYLLSKRSLSEDDSENGHKLGSGSNLFSGQGVENKFNPTEALNRLMQYSQEKMKSNAKKRETAKISEEVTKLSLKIKQGPSRTSDSGKSSQVRKHKFQLVMPDGEVYKCPKLLKPKKFVTDKMYRFLMKKLEPKYDLSSRVKAEEFVAELCNTFVKVVRRKNTKPLIESLMKSMVKLDLVTTYAEFYRFVEDFMPMDFRRKAIPCYGSNLAPERQCGLYERIVLK